MTRQRIIIDTPMASLSLEEQERIWRLSRENDVFERDVNGELWQVIDLSNDKEESVKILTKTE